MDKYIVIDHNELALVRVEAETEDDAYLKAAYFFDQEFVLEHLYLRISGFWGNYFYKKDPNIYPIEECFNDYPTAQKLFLKDAQKSDTLETHKDIILELLSGQDSEESWMQKDPFPWELKRYITTRGYYIDYVAYKENEIPEYEV